MISTLPDVKYEFGCAINVSMIAGSRASVARTAKKAPARTRRERRAQAAKLIPVKRAEISTIKAMRHSKAGSKFSIINKR